ncbi:MAG: RagB/SusD family nutrient uptake outer membrane protein [Sphingobacteriales bacterium]|nr:RagB/SusD family nutrient uptake outer membrane protein [Sphingobacteriales bacterium]
MIRKIAVFGVVLSVVAAGCTKLDEKLDGQLSDQGSSGSINPASLLSGVYESIRGTFQDQAGVYALWEMTTDELIGPTRGGDWDDNGAWRVLHAHKFDADHVRVREVFAALGGVNFAATDLLRYSPSTQQAAEARMLRAFAQFMILDGWGQVPYRDPGESNLQPPRVRVGTEALDYIISELNAIINDLPNGPATKANKNAARVLLMKCYLNKGAYANREAPTFAAADMTQVITLADQVIGSGLYSFPAVYFHNFAPNNDAIGTENIWTQDNVGGSSAGNLRSRWESSMHYNQNPSGWNGFTTLSDFYNKFEAADKRRGINYPYSTPGAPPNPGGRVNVGFLRGQQYNLTTDAPLNDRTGAPLSFTDDVKIIEKGTNLEVTGIRAYKYPIDYQYNDNGNVDNDYVYFRLADVLLMKAEAILRGGTGGTDAGGYGTTAVALVNSVRQQVSRGASALASVTLDQLIDERGRELYLESWRRQDLIRFGKFLQPWQEKPSDDPKYLLFPVPNGQLAANPNLVQNPGY